MKCITYISRAASQKNDLSVPTELASIYHLAKSNNVRHGVTGVLSYRKGYYIQIIEGADEAIGAHNLKNRK